MKKKKISHLWGWKSIILFVAFAICTDVAAQVADSAKIDELLTYLHDNSEAMGSLAISKGGKLLYSRAIGYRLISDKEKIPVNADTKYRIWSVTKMYTATMILQLVEEGKLNLTTTLEQFFPSIQNAAVITMKDMLSHRSGIHDFTDPGDETTEGQAQAAMVCLISKFKSDFQPGEKFQYSNSNYLLLGYIIQQLDRVSYGVALHDRISSKIGITNTYYGEGALDTIENKSLSYQRKNSLWIEVPEGDFSGPVPGAAGSIVSTPSDMVKFIEALFTGKLISKNSLAQMTDIGEFYGLGIFSMNSPLSKGFGHSGGYIASHSFLSYCPEDSLAIAYCTNGQVYGMNSIIDHVINICYNKSYVLPLTRPTIKLDDKTLQKYVGVYETPKFQLTIALENGHLTAQPAGQPKSTLFAFEENRFFLKDVNIEIEFETSEPGVIDKLHIIQGENKLEGEKID